MARREQAHADLRLVSVEVDPVDVRARRHDALHGAVAEAQHPGDHLALVGLDHARGLCLGHDGADLLLGHRALAFGGLPHEAEQQPGRGVEQRDERARDARHERHRRRHRAGDALRALQREVLGHQLPDHHGQIGDHHDDEAVADGLRGGVRNADALEKPGQALAERGAREGAGQDADQGDADLDGREEPAGILRQREGSRGAGTALVGHGLEPDPA
jgi:hypothetical protein